ncbi:putative cuticle collagen 155 [Choloepus didactylus]|uniref:putative cuticle collagen 155 n=1 Tax=Choloepus didactylus TaxID=27675 RepID=UPI00189EED43|nr:putative cuticle collagen 155 [Choloepus didactylus]
MGTSSGRSLNLAAVYKPAGGGGRGRGGRPGPARPLWPLARRQAAPPPHLPKLAPPQPGPAPARLLGNGVNTPPQQPRGAQGSPGCPAASSLRESRGELEGRGDPAASRDPGWDQGLDHLSPKQPAIQGCFTPNCQCMSSARHPTSQPLGILQQTCH